MNEIISSSATAGANIDLDLNVGNDYSKGYARSKTLSLKLYQMLYNT